jgi:hypothetical protein
MGEVWSFMEAEAERKRLAVRRAVEKKVRDVAEREFKKVGSYLDRASSEADRRRRLNEVTALVSKRVVRSFHEKHPELAQSAVELIVVPVVEDLAAERV